MRNTVYWHIYNECGWMEYHCSHLKKDVLDKQALSKKIRSDHPLRGLALKEWSQEIDNMGNIMVEI